MKTPFFGPAYISRSKNLADSQLINLYPEVVETKQGKNIGALYQAPGLRLLATAGAGPIRALHVATFPNDQTLYIVSGGELFRADANFNLTDCGAVSNTNSLPSSPISTIDNGHQLAVFNGSSGFVYQNGAVSPIALPFTGASPILAAYQDGFGAINQAGTAVWWQSDLLDLSTWDALNFASADTNPDNVINLRQIRREMYLFKELGTEVWDNVGTPGFVFARNYNFIIEEGIWAAASLAKSGESLLWLSRSSQGVNVALDMQGYRTKRISTHGLEQEWGGYPTTQDAIGYCYQQAGHSFYVLTFPTADVTWVYDVTTSNLLGIPCWHRRAAIDTNGVWHRHWSNCYATFNGLPVVGDYRSGNLYAFDFSHHLDNQDRRAWLRSWPAVQEGTPLPVRFPPLVVDMETGLDMPDAQDPLVSLKWSDDGGHTWSQGVVAQAGALGATAQRVRFPRLGSTRRNSGLYRIFQISSGDIMAAKLIGADFEIGPQ